MKARDPEQEQLHKVVIERALEDSVRIAAMLELYRKSGRRVSTRIGGLQLVYEYTDRADWKHHIATIRAAKRSRTSCPSKKQKSASG